MLVIHAWMVEIVQIMEHHSLAHARLDIPVSAAKVSIVFKNLLDAFFPFSIFIPEKNFVELAFLTKVWIRHFWNVKNLSDVKIIFQIFKLTVNRFIMIILTNLQQ